MFLWGVDRYLYPLYVPFVISLLALHQVASHSVGRSGSRIAARSLATAIVIGGYAFFAYWLVISVDRTAFAATRSFSQGKSDLRTWERWRDSELVAHIRQNDPIAMGTLPLFSNHPAVLYAQTGFQPIKSMSANRLAQIQTDGQVSSGDVLGYYAWFDYDDKKRPYNDPAVLSRSYALEIVRAFDDGKLYRILVS